MSKLSDAIRSFRRTFCTAVVVAAGTSERMGADKLFLEIAHVPVIARTLSALNRCEAVDEIIVVSREETLDAIGALRPSCAPEKLTKIVLGGATRTESALAGVVAADERAKIICIHDGDRPFVTEAVVTAAVEGAMFYQAAAPAVPVKDTVKVAEAGVVRETPDRAKLFSVQTPQAFQADLIKAALTAAVAAGTAFTDDCAAVEAMGVKPRLTAGDEDNIKLTTPMDLILAEAIYQKREAAET